MALDLVSRRRQVMENAWGRWRPRSLAGMFDMVADWYPARPYVITDGKTYSYQDIAEWSGWLARGLLDLGVAPGEAVALLMDNRAEFVATKLAVARIGAVAVPLNYSYRGDELAATLAHSGAVVLVTISQSMATDFLAALDRIAPDWEPRARSERVPALRHIVLVDGDRSGALTLAGLAQRGRGVSASTLRERTEAIDPDSVCDIVFTSGTSGHPLAADLTHDMVLRSAYGSAYHRGFDDGWRVCFALPMYHVFGYIEGLLASMMVGGAIIPRQVFNPATMLQAMTDHRASEVLLVPTMTVAVVEQAAARHYDLGSLESVFSAAAPAPVWLWKRVEESLAPRTVFTGYGQTEVSAATTLTLPGDSLQVVSETVGTYKLGGAAAPEEMNGVLARYRTVDPFTGHVQPDGTEGELTVRGPIVTRAYHADPEQTKRAVIDGWLHTGDLGTIDSDGYIRLTGRARDLFKVGGELVAPKEIEDLLTSVPGVEQAFVTSVPDDRFGEVGWAWVVPDKNVDLAPEDLLRHCKEHLAPFKVPRAIRIVDAESLPKTTTGKVQKYRLAESAD